MTSPHLNQITSWATRSHGASLIDTLLHSFVASLGWHAGTTLAHFLGAWALLLVGVALVIHICRRATRRVRRVSRRTTRRRGRS